MSILIKGMEMPKENMKNIMILADGRVFQFSGYGNPKPLGTAISVPPHGRLIDADTLIDVKNRTYYPTDDSLILEPQAYIINYLTLEQVKTVPTILEAEGDE